MNSENIEIRSLQMTGRSSYILTLPKEWINTSKLHKNDKIGIITQPDGTLLITSKIYREQTRREKHINVNDKIDQTYLFRQLIGAYISGYSSIKLESSTILSVSVRNIVNKFIQTTVGQEVMEETGNSITLKDLLNPVEMPFDNTIKRMQIVVEGMQKDVMQALITKDKLLLEDVILRDDILDRLNWLIARQYNIISRNTSLAKKMKITTGRSSTSFLISRTIERIGDHIVRLANNILNLIDVEMDNKIVDNINSASDVALDIFRKSIASFFKGDIKTANDVIESVKKLEKQYSEINKLAIQQKGATAVSFGYIVESIRRIGEYAEDISEHVINYLIDEDKKN
jgi:phosphate uptake regulator